MTLHILIVDDAPFVRMRLARLLCENGTSVSQAATGEQALAILDTGPVHLVVADLNLPDSAVAGIDLIQLAGRRGIPTIVVTGQNDPGAAAEMAAMGVLALIAKAPGFEDELLAATRMALDIPA